eukprot:11004178-Lingulodinium_polyedra.AAC.1
MMWSNRPSAAQRLADRTPRTHHASTNSRCPHGAREACDMRTAAAANGGFDRIILHDFRNRAE